MFDFLKNKCSHCGKRINGETHYVEDENDVTNRLTLCGECKERKDQDHERINELNRKKFYEQFKEKVEFQNTFVDDHNPKKIILYTFKVEAFCRHKLSKEDIEKIKTGSHSSLWSLVMMPPSVREKLGSLVGKGLVGTYELLRPVEASSKEKPTKDDVHIEITILSEKKLKIKKNNN